MKLTRLFVLTGIVAAVASAASVTFTFDTQTINGTTITGLAAGATTAQMQSYMNQVLTAAGCTGCTVTLTGAAADQTYNGEGYVVGSNGHSLTLGTSNNATSNSSQVPTTTFDTFLANTTDGSSQVANQITMKFSGFMINGSASMSYEIFPDGTCPVLNSTSCGGAMVNGHYPNQPDMIFEAGTGNNGVGDAAVSSFGTNGTQWGVTPSTTGSDGTSTIGPNGPIVAPQYIGTWSGSLSGVNELDFVDWPATIGVDNLTISWNTTSPVPETSSILLLGTILAGIAARKRFRKAA